MDRAGPLLRSYAISPKEGNYYRKIKKAVSLPNQAKIYREVPLLPSDCEMPICRDLHRRCAIVQGTGNEIIGKNRWGSDNCCFRETGDAIKSNRPIACCGQMITCNTDGAFVVVRHIIMVVRYCHERGNKEKQNEKSSNTFVPEHGAPFLMESV